MIKQKKALLIAGGIMLAGWTFVGYEQQSVAQNNGKVQEYVREIYKLDDITRIEYASGDVITLENKNGVWYNTAFPYLNYNQSLVDKWVHLTQNITTKEIIRNVQDISLYGIDEEATILTIYDSDNQKQTIKLGRSNQEEDKLYIECDGDKLYSISYDEYKELLTRPNDFIECDELLNLTEIHKIQLQIGQEKSIELIKDGNWYLKQYFAFDPMVQETISTHLEQLLKEMKISRYIGTYEDLSPYGLENPKMTLTLNDTTKIEFGNQMGKDVYIRLNNKPDIYVMDIQIFNELKNFKPAKAIDKQVIHMDINEIEQITLSNPQGTYILNFLTQDNKTIEKNHPIEEVETKVVEDITEPREESVIEEQTVATINDIELTTSMVEECFNAIQSSLYIEAPLNNPNIEQKQERKSEATFNFALKDQSTLQIELIPYDINYYILRYDNVIEFAVNKDKITTLFNKLTDAMKK